MNRILAACLLFLTAPLFAQFNQFDPAFVANATKRPSGGTPAPTDYLFHNRPEDIAGAEGAFTAYSVTPWPDDSGNGWDVDGLVSFPPYVTNSVFDGLKGVAFEIAVTHNISTTIPSVTHGIGTGDFTWVIWVYILDASGTYKGLVSNGAFSPCLYFRLNTANWGIYWGADRVSGNTLSQGQWYFLVVRRTGDQVDFWQDGVQTPTQHTIATSMADATWFMGQDGSGGSFGEVIIGEQGVFTRAITDAEIAALFALRTP